MSPAEHRAIEAHMRRIRPLLGILPVEIEDNRAAHRRQRVQAAALVVLLVLALCAVVQLVLLIGGF